ncbi:MAG: hypothetical protein ABI978_01425 [Chloroflexota bacterium]
MSGVGSALVAAGLLAEGIPHPLTYIGGVGYAIVLPIRAFLMGRLLAARLS